MHWESVTKPKHFFTFQIAASVQKTGRGRGAAVGDHQASVAEKVRVLQRAEHALVGVHAGEQEAAHAEVAQDPVERRVPETADPVLVDQDVAGLGDQLVHDGGGPAVLLEHARARAGQRVAEPYPLAGRLVEVDLVGWHVGEVGAVAPVDPDDGHSRLAQTRHQPLQRRDGGTVGRVVGAEVVDPAARRAEVVLHVDDDEGRAQEVDGHALGLAGDGERARRRQRHGHVDMLVGGLPLQAAAVTQRRARGEVSNGTGLARHGFFPLHRGSDHCWINASRARS